MHRQIPRVLLFAISLLCGSARGQSYELELGTAEGTFGEEVGIPLRLSTDAQVQAVQAVFDWDAAAGTGVDIIVEPAVEEAAEFVISHVDANWMAVGIVRSESPLTGNDIALGTAVIRCAPGPDVAESAVLFRNGQYSASSETLVLSNVVTVNGASVREADGLVLTSGSFRCGPTETYGLRLGTAEGEHGGPVQIPLTLSTDAEIQGIQAVFDWDESAGTGLELIVDPAVSDAADLVVSHVDAGWMSVGITTVLNPLTGADIPLATAVIRCGSGPAIEAPVVFRDGVHSAPDSPLVLSNAVTVRGASRLQADGLELTHGSFRCTGEEICDDSVDNDGDGLVDCDDSDCGNDIDVTPLALDFGEVVVGESNELVVTIANLGTCDLAVSAIEPAPESSSDFSVSDGVGAVIRPGDYLAALVTYAPSSAAAASGVLRISSDDADEAVVEISLDGTGVPAPPVGVPQVAADCNQDGARNLADVICMVKLSYPGFLLLDRSVQTAPCTTDDGTVSVLDLDGDEMLTASDIVLLADFLFLGGAPPAQGLECFAVVEDLGCSQNSACP